MGEVIAEIISFFIRVFLLSKCQWVAACNQCLINRLQSKITVKIQLMAVDHIFNSSENIGFFNAQAGLLFCHVSCEQNTYVIDDLCLQQNAWSKV